MPEARPELIHVAGPQKGERAVVMMNSVAIGRQAGVDILISDEYASRKHFQLTATVEGWMLTNLSSNGTVINGKRYKGDKKLILGTGDIIGVGTQTEMLFVEPGHDPEKALQEYRKAHPDASEKAAPAKAPEPPMAPQPPVQVSAVPPVQSPVKPAQSQTKAAIPQQASSRQAAQTAILTPAESESVVGPAQPNAETGQQEAVPPEKKSKTKKFIIYGVIYLVMLTGLIAVLMLRPKGSDQSESDRPVILKPQDIKNLFEKDLKPERERNDDAARQSIDQARKYFGNFSGKRANAYYSVYFFREYKAFSHTGLPLPEDEINFTKAKNDLSDLLVSRYTYAIGKEEQGLWTDAFRAFEDIMTYLPEKDSKKDKDTVEILNQNIIDHTIYVSKRRGKK